MPPRIDLTGQRFGRLVVISEAGRSNDGQTLWHCLCDCGKETTVQGRHLREGNTRSCGCLMQESRIKHGEAGSRLYHTWNDMIQRCHNENHKCYADYGGRGIKVCEIWLHDFAAFRDWAVSNGYVDDLEIDRIDNDRGYSPENCRWTTRKQQTRNCRRNHLIEYRRTTKPLAEWAEEKGMSPRTLNSRIRNGWTVEEALETPVGESKSHKKK